MAFRQSTIALPRRNLVEDASEGPQLNLKYDVKKEKEAASPSGAAQRPYTSISRWPQLQQFGPSPLSDFGSLNTIAHSEAEDGSNAAALVTDEVDSLDEGLRAFQDPPLEILTARSNQNLGAILPVHDGLGTFSPSRTPFDNRARSPDIGTPQHDTDVPRPTRLALSSDSINVRQSTESAWLDEQRMRRIEQWRLEHSRYLRRQIREAKGQTDKRQRIEKDEAYAKAELKDCPRSNPQSDSTHRVPPSSPIWQRFAQHIVQDLMGIDDSMLCLLFGEELLCTEDTSVSDLQTSDQHLHSPRDWQSRLLRRLQEEIQRLALQLLPDDHSAPPLGSRNSEYAGIPLDWLSKRYQAAEVPAPDVVKARSLGFTPTLQTPYVRPGGQAAQVDRDIADTDGLERRSGLDTGHQSQISNLRTVLRLLYRHFLSFGTLKSDKNASDLATTQSSEALRRAAFIQQHHPLASRSRPRNYEADRASQSRQFNGSLNLVAFATGIKRHNSSCASWSTKRSRRTTSDQTSKNYWDVGESIGTGSAIIAGAGAWGEL